MSISEVGKLHIRNYVKNLLNLHTGERTPNIQMKQSETRLSEECRKGEEESQ